AGSGIRFMSDSWIAFQPAIEEPSNIWPSAKVSSDIKDTSNVTCCHFPRGSVKRKSAYFTSLSLINFITSLAVVMERLPFHGGWPRRRGPVAVREDRHGSDGVQSGFPRPDPDGFFDVGDENLAVADPPGLGGASDRLDGLFDHVVAEHNLDLHLGEKIDDVFGSAIKLGVAFLPAKALGLGHGDALQPDLLQRFLHLVELEGLDHRLDFLHRISFPRPAGERATGVAALALAGSVPSPAGQRKCSPINQLTAIRQPLATPTGGRVSRIYSVCLFFH